MPRHRSPVCPQTAACLGCVTPILQDGADLRRVANMAAKLLEDELDSKYTFRVTEVYRASKQVRRDSVRPVCRPFVRFTQHGGC